MDGEQLILWVPCALREEADGGFGAFRLASGMPSED